MSRRRSRRNVLVLVIALALVFGSITYFVFGPGSALTRPQTPVYTWTPNLSIEILKADNSTLKVKVPGNIGVAGGTWFNHTLDDWGIPGKQSVLYTRPSPNDSSTFDGHIYVSPVYHAGRFTLSDFFNVWGQKLTDKCISIGQVINECSGSTGTLVLEIDFHNGQGPIQEKVIGGQILRDGEDIFLEWFES